MTSSPSHPHGLKVLIVGAGLSGLTAAVRLAQQGHTVHVLERQPKISPRGGGILFFPNVTRIFESWGLTGAFKPIVDVLEKTEIRRHGDEKVLRRIYHEEQKGYPSSWYVHRAGAQKTLYDTATQLGVHFLFSARIASINQSNPSITLDSGSILHADLIIGADGHASFIRDSISPSPTPEKRTGVVFQVPIPYPLPTTLPTALPSHSSADKGFTFFVGPGRYAVVWPAKEYLDVQFGDEGYPHPSISNAAQLSDMEYLRQRFADFSPTLLALLSTVEDTHRWQIAFLPPLNSWRSPSGRVVLMGDAAHAMGPYAGQGACQGIEDAAVLSELLHPSINAEDIATMTELYQALRKPRAEKAQGIAWKYREQFILGDGPLQRKRDELFRILESGRGAEGQSRDEAWLERYDAVGEARGLLRRVKGGLMEAKL